MYSGWRSDSLKTVLALILVPFFFPQNKMPRKQKHQAFSISNMFKMNNVLNCRNFIIFMTLFPTDKLISFQFVYFIEYKGRVHKSWTGRIGKNECFAKNLEELFFFLIYTIYIYNYYPLHTFPLQTHLTLSWYAFDFIRSLSYCQH